MTLPKLMAAGWMLAASFSPLSIPKPALRVHRIDFMVLCYPNCYCGYCVLWAPVGRPRSSSGNIYLCVSELIAQHEHVNGFKGSVQSFFFAAAA